MSAMNAEFFDAIEQIEKEKGIPRGYMQEKIQQALLTAFKRDNPDCEDNVEVIMDEGKKSIAMFVLKTIVEEGEYVNDATQILLDEAQRYDKKAHIGDVVRIPVETKKFGRIAAQAAKQVIIQGIREAERGIIYDEFTSKEHEILTGVVTRIEPRTGAVSIKISSNSEFTEAMLSPTERIKGEELAEGDRIKVYVVEVRKSTRGPQVLISRTHPGLVKRLFELEVPEIFDGTVEIRSGSINYTCNLPLRNVPLRKLFHRYLSIPLYIENDANCAGIVPDGQLSLAIGKEGQNARLAARLTGYKIDIKPESAPGE